MEIKKTNKKIYISIAFFVIAMCIFHYLIRSSTGDTIRFLEFIQERNLQEFLVWRYETVTSRIILEAMLYGILSSKYIVFAFINIIFILCLVYSIIKLFDIKENEGILLLLLFLSYPFQDLVVVGIQPASINYIWSMMFAIIACIPIKMVLNGEKISWWQYIVFIISALISANMEQTAAILVCVYILFSVYFSRNKKNHPILWIQLAIALCSNAFLLFGSGNVERMQMSIDAYWPGFEKLSIFEKLWYGISTTTNHLLSIPNVPFLLFSFSLFVAVWFLYKKVNIYTICGTIPFLWSGFVIGIKVLDLVFGKNYTCWLNGINNPYTDALTNPFSVYIPLILQIIIILMCVVSIWGCFDTIGQKLLVFLILCAGGATRVMMGFSPTLFASHTRTFFFLYISFFICCAFLMEKVRGKNTKVFRLSVCLMLCVSVISFITECI